MAKSGVLRDAALGVGCESPVVIPRIFIAKEAALLLEARDKGATTVDLSVDFGLSLVDAKLQEEGVEIPQLERLLSWSDVEMVEGDENGCFLLLDDGTLDRIAVFSETTGRSVSLMTSQFRAPPTALIAGFPMHRFGKGVDPREDTMKKMKAIGRMRTGQRVLDICTGLGYTAISATADGPEVTTIELDDAMQQMCQLNPWSQGLYNRNVKQLIGNAADLVKDMPDSSFDRIVHDPPTFALAGDLYSKDFYAELRRILSPQGKLYHYVGDPDSRAAGKHFQGILRRLQDAGFEGAATDFDAHGVVASHQPMKARGRQVRKKEPGSAASKAAAAAKGRNDRGTAKRTNKNMAVLDFEDNDDDDF